jgi:hypothetical protein
MKSIIFLLLLVTSLSSFAQSVSYECRTYSPKDLDVESGKMDVSIDLESKMAWLNVDGEVDLGQLISTANLAYKIRVEDQGFQGIVYISDNTEVNVLSDYTESIISEYNLIGDQEKTFRKNMNDALGDKKINASVEILGTLSVLMSCE